MTKLSTIDFDDRILDALREDKLVIFAGAGVSMGHPSNLASFVRLANEIAQGTGHEASEPLDRFLGQLHHKQVAVHERAAQLLSPEGSEPNALHYDLLRLFRSLERIRIVTTNFDAHFETAAQALYGGMPDVYRAPALPLGYKFTGIVHVHGIVTHSNDLVLTDADFGRAYLTEGWARRFLVEVFRRYTVLFIGYSHGDIVMNYLARALPSDSIAGRFALTEEVGNWDLLGIKPIHFRKGSGAEAYKELYEGVQKLAERANRGVLDWQTRMAEIGGRAPPVDEEAITEVEQALREVHTTRFLLAVARDAEWPEWMDARNHLDKLFSGGELSERDKLLAQWLAENFVIEHPDSMFNLFASNGLSLNPSFWWSIGRELGVMKEKTLEDSALKRWVTILLSTAPPQADHHVLMWLAERCAHHGVIHLTLKVFFRLIQHRLSIKPGFDWYDQEKDGRIPPLEMDCILCGDNWSLNEVWTNCLKPNMDVVIQPLLSGIILRLEEIHNDFMAWDKASPEWDPSSYGRSAIEQHEQDRHPEAIDVLIDAVRDALESLANDTPALLDAWIQRLVASDAPLLRRLAVHAITVHPSMSADECLKWLLDHVDLSDSGVHHEMYRAVARSYAAASNNARQSVVDTILACKQPASGTWSAEKVTEWTHFEWLSWLLQATPGCAIAEAALAPIKDKYPKWTPSKHPDFTHWSGSADWIGSQSPWSIEQLLAQDPNAQIDDLLSFKGTQFDGPDRAGLIATVKDACKQQTLWGFALLEALSKRSLYSSDLFPAVMRGLGEADLTVEQWRTLLTAIEIPKLQVAYPSAAARLLQSIVKDGGKPFALDLLEQANTIAVSLWHALELEEEDENVDDWLRRAINRPAGVIVEFWIQGLSLVVRDKSSDERTLPDNYRQWFTTVIEDSTPKGGLGRSLLASQTAFLFGLNEPWTRQHIIPLFTAADQKKWLQSWDGFLVWGQLNPTIADALIPAFIAAFQRINAEFTQRSRQRFIEVFTTLAVIHVADPTPELLQPLFQYGAPEDRVTFASRLGYFLRQLPPAAKKDLWERWLHRYWQERLHAIPAALEEGEIRAMLDWLPHLLDSFPAAVSLAIRAPAVRIEHSQLLYEFRKSDLVTRYGAETADLLIYLCGCVHGYFAAELGKVAARLPTLAPDLRHRLDETLARAGVI
jgi:hypothetical protein